MSYQNNTLKRSQKADFNSSGITRERSFIKQSNLQKRKSQTMATIKGKPTMEIYRPPNVRTDLPQGVGKLNVHAKEFTMNHELQMSKSSGNLAHMLSFDGHHLQQSRSSGHILRHVHHPLIPVVPTIPLPLMHSSSTSIIQHIPQRVNFQMPGDPMQSPPIQPPNFGLNRGGSHNIKRSKSMSAADHQNQAMSKLKGFSKDEIDIGSFPEAHQNNLKTAIEDPNQLPSRTLMDLVKIILERVVEGIRYSEAGAKLCISIIEKEKNQTFLESLLNTCQQWYQERDKFLRGIKAGDGTRFTAFMWFLTEMCGQLKRHKMRSHAESLQPDLVILSVLAKCCQACVSLPIKCLAETECLFFVLTSIGRDLENELQPQLEQLLASVRDGFLASAGSPPVRRTLLQLIELHASNWQLPGSSVLYYYPRIK